MDESQVDRLAQLASALAPGAKLIDHWPLTGGVSSQTTAIEVKQMDGRIERFVVRAHSPQHVARKPDIAEHEFRVLQQLHRAGFPVPRPIFLHRGGEVFDGPAIVIDFVDGIVVTKPEDPIRYATELAYWMSSIHDLDLASNDLAFLSEDSRHAQNRFVPRSNDSRIARSICEALESVHPIVPRNSLVLLHGDFWRSNLLWNDGKLAAIIDWEDAAIGEPLADVARTRLELFWNLGEEAQDAFTEHYLVFRETDIEDLAIWDLVMSIGPSRALPQWGLRPARERELSGALERFVRDAEQRLAVRRS